MPQRLDIEADPWTGMIYSLLEQSLPSLLGGAFLQYTNCVLASNLIGSFMLARLPYRPVQSALIRQKLSSSIHRLHQTVLRSSRVVSRRWGSHAYYIFSAIPALANCFTASGGSLTLAKNFGKAIYKAALKSRFSYF